MILYHYKQTTLICPDDGCFAETIEGPFTRTSKEDIDRFLLLVRHPLERLKTIYQSDTRGMEFKHWIRSVNVPQAMHLHRNPDAIIRVEHFTEDIEERLGIHTTISISPPEGHIDVCLTSRVLIRQLFKDDYQIGEYD